MAWLVYADISSELETGHDQKRVERQLRKIEQILKNCNVNFNAPAVSTKLLEGANGEKQTIFDTRPFKDITSVKIKQYRSTSETVLVEDEDYKLSEHVAWSDELDPTLLYIRIELINNYCVKTNPEYLEVNATWGITVTVPQVIEDAVVDYINKYETYMINTGGGANVGALKKAKTGESEVEYETNSNSDIDRTVSSNPAEDEELMSVLNDFCIC